MVKVHSLGLPRIGKHRELKKALEKYWKEVITEEQLHLAALSLKKENWSVQLNNGLDFITVGDFSYYDHILDTTILFDNIPQRFKKLDISPIDRYFSIARGSNSKGVNVVASDMRKWFNTNYHYIVPEFNRDSSFLLNPKKIINEIEEAKSFGVDYHRIKPVITGPLTYLWLGKESGVDRLNLLPELVKEYKKLFILLKHMGIEWVQVDEPILVLDDLGSRWKEAFESTYRVLKSHTKILLTTYFEGVEENLHIISKIPVEGFHFDLTKEYCDKLVSWKGILESIPDDKILSFGVVSGRNIWISDIKEVVSYIKEARSAIGDRLWIGPSCSLQHLPVTSRQEDKITDEQKSWLKFAYEKIEELSTLRDGVDGKDIANELKNNRLALKSLKRSRRQSKEVKKRLNEIKGEKISRISSYDIRSKKQAKTLNLPLLPSTTIGSFPQTNEIRKTRQSWRKGILKDSEYKRELEKEIKLVINRQEELGLDVLVHGEAERTDMVEYFGELLDGYLVTRFGWVQSYGSRCVKPPIIYKDVTRVSPMTVEWIKYAQSLTKKYVKGMLTGPITMLKWSFVREDVPFSQTAEQVALTLNDEVRDLVEAGIKIIQIDEAALREALPLKSSHKKHYLEAASRSFRLCSLGVEDEIQIHTHMCYSNFDDILTCISEMDSDVITIETTRSRMGILSSFPDSNIINEIGPGIYDIHSPNIPKREEMEELLKLALKTIPANRLWNNPDCGLKTRKWDEILPSLKNMIDAGNNIREKLLINS